MPDIGPIETLTYAAACTDSLRLGCAVFVTPLHNPVHLAKAIASLDQLSRGRLQVGFGIGGSFRDFAAFGLTPEHLVTRFNEGVALIRALWAQDRVDFDGTFWHLEGVAMEPKPFQKPGPPIWFGGGHPDAVRRAVRTRTGSWAPAPPPPPNSWTRCRWPAGRWTSRGTSGDLLIGQAGVSGGG